MNEQRQRESLASGWRCLTLRLLLSAVVVATLAAGCQQQSTRERTPTVAGSPTMSLPLVGTATVTVPRDVSSPAPDEPPQPQEVIITPDASVGDAIMLLNPGDTLFLRGGTYEERIEIAPPHGTAARPITIAAYPDERPVIRGLLWLEDARHIVIDGINVVWDDDRNKKSEHLVNINGGAYVTLQGVEIWNAKSHSNILFSGGVRDWELLDCYIHDNRGKSDNQDHLIYVNEAHDGLIEGCLLVNSPKGRAIKLGSLSGKDPVPDGIVVRYNTMIDNFGPSNIQLSYGARNCVIEKNIMVGSGAENVTAFELKGRNNLVRDNVGYQSQANNVVATHKGILDGGGNVNINPQLDDEYIPHHPTLTTPRGLPLSGHAAARQFARSTAEAD